MRGTGVEKDEEEGLKWVMKAAKQKDADAECSVGIAYMIGIGAAKDAVEAARWIRKAAEQGHEGAQAALAARSTDPFLSFGLLDPTPSTEI
jgi:TPR repeat protein